MQQNHVFEKRKDNCFRNFEVLRVLINNNSITRNDIEAIIRFYREVRVIPQKYFVQIIKINNINTNINDSKLTFRKLNNLRKRFANIELYPHFLYDATNF